MDCCSDIVILSCLPLSLSYSRFFSVIVLLNISPTTLASMDTAIHFAKCPRFRWEALRAAAREAKRDRNPAYRLCSPPAARWAAAPLVAAGPAAIVAATCREAVFLGGPAAVFRETKKKTTTCGFPYFPAHTHTQTRIYWKTCPKFGRGI